MPGASWPCLLADQIPLSVTSNGQWAGFVPPSLRTSWWLLKRSRRKWEEQEKYWAVTLSLPIVVVAHKRTLSTSPIPSLAVALSEEAVSPERRKGYIAWFYSFSGLCALPASVFLGVVLAERLANYGTVCSDVFQSPNPAPVELTAKAPVVFP